MQDRSEHQPSMTREVWEDTVLTPARAQTPERAAAFQTASGHPVDVAYTPDDIAALAYDRDLGDPGAFPFTRGTRESGYRETCWTMRSLAGVGTPEAANVRYRHALASGATGLTMVFDPPTLAGHDPDHATARDAVGQGGVSVASAADMAALVDGIAIENVPVSMAIDAPAPVLLALYLVVAEERGIAWSSLSGTLQHDILGALVAGAADGYPPRQALRLMTDVFAFAHRHLPRWEVASPGGLHLHARGATAQQELSFVMASAVEYVKTGVAAGLDVDAVASRVSCTFSARHDFFEEIARLRAARRIWARETRGRFGATTRSSCALRVHTYAVDAPSAVRTPQRHAVQTAFQTLAAVLGGTESLVTAVHDDAPSPLPVEAVTHALRTQQILAHESGLTSVVDPFGGAWWLERLTDDMAEQARTDIAEIDRAGGMVAALEQGMLQRYLAAARTALGDAHDVPRDSVLAPAADDTTVRAQCRRVEDVRRRRDQGAVAGTLAALGRAASGTANLMETLVACARARATVGEMCEVLRDAWGRSGEVPET